MSSSAIIPTIPADVKLRLLAGAKLRTEEQKKQQAKVKPGKPRDVRFVEWAAYWTVKAVGLWGRIINLAWLVWLAKNGPRYYPLAKSFAKAHAGLFTLPKTQAARKAICDGCPYRYDYAGREWCRGENDGKGCGCGHWAPANLVHKRRLAAFKCPQGKFGYGGLVKLVVRR